LLFTFIIGLIADVSFYPKLATMSKRKRNATFRDDDGSPPDKRARDESDVGSREHSSLHQSSSSSARQFQRPDLHGGRVLGEVHGLPTHGDDHESAEDALAYLRSVRDEAQALPNMMRAQSPDVKEETDVDEANPRLYYDSEGTWVARSIKSESRSSLRSRRSSVTLTNDYSLGPEPVAEKAAIPLISPINAYANSVIVKFFALREQLRTLRNKIPSDDWHLYQPYELSNTHTKAYNEFRSSISQTAPIPIRLAATNKEMYLNLLLCASKLLKKGKIIDKMLSVWLFALLARCNDVGTLTNDDVFVVRSTAKRAIQMLSGFAKKSYLKVKILDQIEDKEDQAVDDHGAETVKTEYGTGNEALTEPKDVQSQEVAVEEQGKVRREPVLPDMNTRATLYMIVLIAGEVYGQKDLVEYLEWW
jgi:hypothetical protein